jgi:hypothetical protein
VHVPRTAAELTALKVSALRAILDHHNVRAEDCIEKADLVARIMDRIVSKMP